MDAPQHTRMRKIVSRGFTPRAVDRLRADLTQRALQIVADAATAKTGDFVAQVASELPLQLVAGLLGVPFEDRSKLFHWTNEMVGDEDPEFAGSFSFNVLRDPNPHLSFGGTGVHYCLGANLARMTVGVMFDQSGDPLTQPHTA